MVNVPLAETPAAMEGGIAFSKYHGCGNDFILVEDLAGRQKTLFQDAALMRKMCDRFTGIGADAVLYVTSHGKHDFLLDNYTARYGTASGLCGNGSRCGVQFAKDCGIIAHNQGTFFSFDGPHDYSIDRDGISIKLADVPKDAVVQYNETEFYLYVGSPHHVKFVDNLEELDVHGEGQKIWCRGNYIEPDNRGNVGVNVNFAEITAPDMCRIRTYERTVGRETQACGTGSVSSAIATAVLQKAKSGLANGSKTRRVCAVNNGGNLTITFTEESDKFSDVWLSGPAEKVFSGVYLL